MTKTICQCLALKLRTVMKIGGKPGTWRSPGGGGRCFPSSLMSSGVFKQEAPFYQALSSTTCSWCCLTSSTVLSSWSVRIPLLLAEYSPRLPRCVPEHPVILCKLKLVTNFPVSPEHFLHVGQIVFSGPPMAPHPSPQSPNHRGSTPTKPGTPRRHHPRSCTGSHSTGSPSSHYTSIASPSCDLDKRTKGPDVSRDLDPHHAVL
ncbi:hypothetical protein CRENBAI_020695 [Crenichthys baileyi]|uniref:Uncharacterized protein n=1 Tax=Crenichthys baileyi TaxID=28760 RepID=A0AAV9S0D1_9TELE